MGSVSYLVSSVLRNSMKRYCLFQIPNVRPISLCEVNYSKKDSSDMPKNTLEEHITAHKQPTYGLVYDKKPFKVALKANKLYSWCCCGWSKNQPFCDGSHKNPYVRIELRPVRFMVEEDKEYYLCNCKQTKHRPFCDGTHKREDIQEQVRS
uniref:Iron-binding zinc finger CDGSH type domain-containing protein n=1 Tax=Homalodisca liturata TaxID=320908 RepID=A0A1B6J4C8_9HEMI